MDVQGVDEQKMRFVRRFLITAALLHCKHQRVIMQLANYVQDSKSNLFLVLQIALHSRVLRQICSHFVCVSVLLPAPLVSGDWYKCHR